MKQRLARKRARAKDRVDPCHVHKKRWNKPDRYYVLFDDVRRLFLVWQHLPKSVLPLFTVKGVVYRTAALKSNATNTRNVYEINNLIEQIGHTGKWRPIRIK